MQVFRPKWQRIILQSLTMRGSRAEMGEEPALYRKYICPLQRALQTVLIAATMRRWSSLSVCLSICALTLGSRTDAQQPSPFQLMGTFQSVGSPLAQIVGPGPSAGSQRLYVSVASTLSGFDILVIDPVTQSTSVFHTPISGEQAAWGLAVGPDGNIYMGTTPHGHFVRLNVASGVMEDLGSPSPTESIIWQVAVGTDNLIY